MHLKSYTLEYKLKVVEYVSLYNVSIATKEFNVAKSNIYRWVNNQENLRQGVKDKNKMCRKIHDGRKPILEGRSFILIIRFCVFFNSILTVSNQSLMSFIGKLTFKNRGCRRT